jgi:hypothetical protein
MLNAARASKIAKNAAQSLPILAVHETKVAAFQLLDFLDGEEPTGVIHGD